MAMTNAVFNNPGRILKRVEKCMSKTNGDSHGNDTPLSPCGWVPVCVPLCVFVLGVVFHVSRVRLRNLNSLFKSGSVSLQLR